MLLRIVLIGLCATLAACAKPDPLALLQAGQQPTRSTIAEPKKAPAPAVDGPVAVDSLKIRFEKLLPKEGLTVSITVIGDSDGRTTFANRTCCGMGDVRAFIYDVRVQVAE